MRLRVVKEQRVLLCGLVQSRTGMATKQKRFGVPLQWKGREGERERERGEKEGEGGRERQIDK